MAAGIQHVQTTQLFELPPSGTRGVSTLRNKTSRTLILNVVHVLGADHGHVREMDGLDTYRAILEIHTKQKAIIVNGFSETKRVKEAKSLRAEDYLQKPYVQEKLGLANKERT